MLTDKMNTLVEENYLQARSLFGEAKSPEDLYQAKVEYLGKQGKLTSLMKQLSGLSKEERPLVGRVINEKKQALLSFYEERLTSLESDKLNKALSKTKFNFTLSRDSKTYGQKHPITLVIDEMVDILSRLGFSVRTGPHIESDDYNFTFLNFPKGHPARDMQDTFYVDSDHVLRTHTSPIQIRTMLTEKPPLRVIAPGSVFRSDSDISHSPNFHQVEGLYVDKSVSMSHLKGIVGYFVKELFGSKTKTRFRPSFFPFTEPSAEVDCTCPLCSGKGCRVCSNSGWIEIGGCGLVHPNVLKSCNLDPDEFQGLAFGFGAERMAMIKYGISDIRLFNENLISFVEQF
jgi:phenylalanyl-tRNA synthetase alpha chain